MFSSVFDKVVSATAPDTLATFPPRAALPASASTLCCLSFADRFISHYPTDRAKNTADDVDGALLLGRIGPSVGIAISTDDLESTMESAAELGGRLAAALAGTVRSKRREPASASVPDLLTKVRGIFGNRLACVGREIRVSRNVQAERDETLLLRQVHALKNAALDACNGQKWCVVVSSGGESLVVCSVPLPAVEEGAACGCDFLVFDPSPRPAMKLRGSYIVKFTTVRGLQLHLLSALGEIWREGGLPLEGGAKKEFIGLSVVMKAKERGGQPVGRRQLEDSVASLRKAEKAAAIKTKREEVEALRKALEKSSRQPKPSLTAPISGGMLGLTDGLREASPGDDVSDLSSGPPSFRRSARSYRQQELPRATTVDRSSSLPEALKTCDGKLDQIEPKDNVDPRLLGMATTPPLMEFPAPHVGLSDQVSQGGCREFPGSRKSCGDWSHVRPPVADVSPPLSARTPERKKGWRHGSAEDDGEVAGSVGGGQADAVSASKRREDSTARSESAEQLPGQPDQDEAEMSDSPLHRALLRSIEGEELAEYSKRAYSVYRTHGVIQDEAGIDDYRASEPTAHVLSTSSNQVSRLTASSPPASPSNVLHGTRSCKAIPADDVNHHAGASTGCDPVGTGVRDVVVPFSPPPSSPNELRVTDFSEADDVFISNKPNRSAASPSKTFRSRPRAPRAGRVVASASTKARGKCRSRREEKSPGKELLPPVPPSGETTTVPPRLKEAWIKEGGEVGHELHVKTGGHESELEFSCRVAGTTLEVSDEDEDGISAHISGDSPRRKAMEHSEGSGKKRRFAGQESMSTQDMEAQERVTNVIETGRGGNSEHSSDEHVNIAENSQGWPMDGSAAIKGSGPVTSRAPSTSPRLKATTLKQAKECRGRCDRSQSHVPGLEAVSTSNSSSTTLLVAPPLPNTSVRRLHRSRNSDSCDQFSATREAVDEPEKALDNKDFVWFGQADMDTPSGGTPAEDRTHLREVREEGAPAAAPAARGAARTTAEPPLGPLIFSPHQQRSKAQLLLQMEVRRQRAIIDQAFRAREEEHRVRRARIGAEVFRRIQDLRRRRAPSPSPAPAAPPTSAPRQRPSPVEVEPTNPPNDDHDSEPQSTTRDAQEDAAVQSPPCARNAATAWGFRTAPSEKTAKAVQPEGLVPDTATSEGEGAVTAVVAIGKVPPVETLAPVPPPEVAHRVAPVADNPWRRIVRMQKKPELESATPATRAPTPPPIRFNVEANAFQDGAERPNGGANHQHGQEQDNARRHERYEALRARKMAEAEERRQGQKQRKAAAREQQRKTAAAAATATAVAVADEEQQPVWDIRDDPRRQNLAHYDSPLAHRPSTPGNDYTPRTSSAVRPRSLSLSGNNDSYTRRVAGSLGDSNGTDGGGGRPRLPAPGAVSAASPAVRGFSRRSNRKLVRNAINFLCLAGGHLEKKKARVLEALDSHPAANFVVLLAHTKLLSFKGLYACNGDEDGTADRVFGLGPPHVDATMVSGFFKYNSAAREFREVHSKSLGKTTDAVSMEPTRLRRPKGLAI